MASFTSTIFQGYPAGFGTVSLSQRLPQFRRACPSTALDESISYSVGNGNYTSSLLPVKLQNRTCLCEYSTSMGRFPEKKGRLARHFFFVMMIRLDLTALGDHILKVEVECREGLHDPAVTVHTMSHKCSITLLIALTLSFLFRTARPNEAPCCSSSYRDPEEATPSPRRNAARRVREVWDR